MTERPQWTIDEQPLRPEGEPPSDHPEPPGSGRRRRPLAMVVVALLILGSATVWYLLLRRAPEVALVGDEGTEAAAGVRQRPVAEPPLVVPEVEPLELPSLGASDPLVRRLVGELSSHPRLMALLVDEELVRRFVVTVDNVATGDHPAKHWPGVKVEGAFATEGGADRLVVSPAAHRRYDLLTDVFVSLDAAGSARLYRQLEPLVDQAYRDLGYPDADFDDTLERAIAILRSTPVVAPDARLTKKVRGYAYADPELEALSPAQKQLIRTGPDNQRRIQAQLARLAGALGMG